MTKKNELLQPTGYKNNNFVFVIGSLLQKQITNINNKNYKIMKTIEKMKKNLKAMNFSEMNQINGGGKYIVIKVNGVTWYIQLEA